MLVAQVLPYVRSLATRKLSDEELVEDVQFLKEELGEKFESLTCTDLFFSWLALICAYCLEPTMNMSRSSNQGISHGLQSTNRTRSGRRTSTN